MSQRTPKSSAAELREKLGISLGPRSQYTDKAWELVKWADDADMLSAHINNWELLSQEKKYEVGDIIMLPWGWLDELIKPLEPWWSQVKIISVGCSSNPPKWVHIAEWEFAQEGFYSTSKWWGEYYEVEYPDGERKWWVRGLCKEAIKGRGHLWEHPHWDCEAMSIPRMDWGWIPKLFVKDYGKAEAFRRFNSFTMRELFCRSTG